MLIQPPRIAEPFALLDPDIPGRTEPQLSTGEWGINLAAAVGNFPGKGLKVHIPAWSIMSKGDRYELIYDGGIVDQGTVTDDTEIGDGVTLWVAPGRITEGSHTLSYVVRRLSQKEEPYSPPVRLFIKLALPGGQDLDPEPGSHSEFHQSIHPAIVADGVDKETAKKGVDITITAKPGSPSRLPYPNIAVDDVITLSWGGVMVLSAPVNQSQIDDPDSNPIIIHVSEAVILQAGDSDAGGLAVTFIVHDLVNNAAEDWCAETRIVVDTGNSRLDAPILRQADGNVLDLDSLGDEELDVAVWAASADFQLDDVIIMTVSGTSADGESIIRKARKIIDKRPPLVVDVPLPNSAARALAKTQALFSYELERGGSVIQRSKGRFINIIGEPYRLAAPIAEDAQNGAIDPDLPVIRIRIPYDERIEEGMVIDLKWFGIRADLTTYEPVLKWTFPSAEEAKDPAGFIIVVEDNRHLKTLEGGTLDLSYNLLKDEDGEIVSVASVHAALLNVGEAKFELVEPAVLGVKDGALEPKDLVNGTSKVTCPNPVVNPTKANDVVTWELRDANGVVVFEDNKKLGALNAGKDVDFPLTAAFVQQYFEARRGERLNVRYNILRFATDKISYSNPLEFLIGTAAVLDPPTIESVKGAPSGLEIPNGGSTSDSSLALTGTGHPGQKIELRDKSAPLVTVTVLESGEWTYTLTAQVLGAHSYTAKALYGDEVESVAWTLAVMASTAPTISEAQDSKGVMIPQGATTVDTTITLSGTGAEGQKVQIKDGTTVKGEATVDPTTGLWDLTMTGLTVAAHSFTATALYGSGQVSAARTLTVTASTAPDITLAADSKGVVIPEGATTVDTTVKLSGAGAKGQKVQIKDGTTFLGEVMVDPTTGLWDLTMTDLSVSAHSFTATALYGDGQVSAAWTLTVTASTAPTITLAVDSQGVVIPEGATTVDTKIKLSGAGAKGQKVQIKDGTIVKGEATVDLTTGLWDLTMTGLTVAAYSFTATALYGNGAGSTPPYVLNVASLFTPSITLVTDSKGTVNPGATTYDTSVTASGEGSAGQQLQIYNNGVQVGSVITIGTDGQWSINISNLAIRSHSLIARALYPVNPVDSQPRTFTVAVSITREDFEYESEWKLHHGQTKRLRTMEITELTSPNHYMGIVMPYSRPGVGLSGGVLFITQPYESPTSFSFRIRFLKPYRRIDFWYEFAINFAPTSSARADYYDSNGRLLGTKNFNTIDGPQQQISFTSEGITSMVIRGALGQHLYFDKFEFYSLPK